MKVQSARFGELDVPENQVFSFPHGIPGFPEEKSFALIPHDEESPFAFFQSVAEKNLTFLIVDPFFFFKDYEFDLNNDLAGEMGLSQENRPQVFLIATTKGEVSDMTVNLLAPLVLNGVDHTGRQVILDKSEYSICHKLFPDGLSREAVEGGR